MEPLRGSRGGSAQTPVPDAVARRSGGVHSVSDGPRAASDAAVDQEPRVAGHVPGPAVDDDPAASARDNHLHERLHVRPCDPH